MEFDAEDDNPYTAFADLSSGLIMILLLLVCVLAARTKGGVSHLPMQMVPFVQMTSVPPPPGDAPPSSLPSEPVFSIAQDGRNATRYERGLSILRPHDRTAIMQALAANWEGIKTIRANTLLVEGYASPEPYAGRSDRRQRQTVPSAPEGRDCSKTGDGAGSRDCRRSSSYDYNMDLAFERARKVQEFLVVELGLPRWCLSVVSHGRNRSKLLRSQTDPSAGEDGVEIFDRNFKSDAVGDLSGERKIEMRAVADPRSLCTPEELAVALDKLRR